jgi:hypothetical protein
MGKRGERFHRMDGAFRTEYRATGKQLTEINVALRHRLTTLLP